MTDVATITTADAPSVANQRERDLTQFVARHLTQFLLDRSLRWQQALDIDRLDALLLQVTLSGNLAHLPLRDAGLHADDALRRPVCAMSMAHSTGVSYETVRRRAIRLASVGMLTVADDGYVAPRLLIAAGPGAVLPADDRAAVIALLRVMHAQGYPVVPAVLAIDAVHDDGRIARAVLDCALRCLERFINGYGGMVAGRVWAAVMAANIRHLLDDPDLSMRHTGGSLLPDEARQSISLRKLARELDMPFETVRRHVATMIHDGRIVATRTGVIVPKHILEHPDHRRECATLVTYLRRMIDDMARLCTT